MCPGRSLPGWCSRHRARAQHLVHDKREQRGSVSPATRLQRKPEICVTTNTRFCPEPASESDAGPGTDSDAGPGTDSDAGPGTDSDAGPGADSDSGPRGDHQLGNKTGFPPRTWPYTHAVPSAPARKTQGARAHPPIPLDRPGGTPSVHSGRFPPLTGGCFLLLLIYRWPFAGICDQATHFATEATFLLRGLWWRVQICILAHATCVFAHPFSICARHF